MEQLKDQQVVDLKAGTNKDLVIIDFYSTWCSPCSALLPLLEEQAESYKIVKADVDECPQSVASYGIRGIPTLVAIKDGVVLASRTGKATRQELSDWLEELD